MLEADVVRCNQYIMVPGTQYQINYDLLNQVYTLL
jgi:predicted component of type VI protein secretion system